MDSALCRLDPWAVRGQVVTEIAREKAALIVQPLKVLFLVGSASCGRKTAAEIIASSAPTGPWVMDGFQIELRERAHMFHKIVEQGPRMLPAPWFHFNGQLDIPTPAFDGLSPRQAYRFAEQHATRMFGAEVIGKWTVQRVRWMQQAQQKRLPEAKWARGVMFVDDAPQASLVHAVKEFGKDNCTQVVIKRTGQSSLPILSEDDVRTVHVVNPGDSRVIFERNLREALPHVYIEIVKSL